MAQVTWEEAAHRFEHAKTKVSNAFGAGAMEGKRVLDVGCGIGNVLLAAASYGASHIIGVDINLREFGYNHFLELGQANNIDVTRITMIEGDLTCLGISGPKFDFVTALDVIEHVQNPASVIRSMSSVTESGGRILIDTCPLYFSPAGHHLFKYFPQEEYPWIHLWSNFPELVAAREVDRWSMDRFHELNKVTVAQLDQAIEDAGLLVLTKHIGTARVDTAFAAMAHDISRRTAIPESELLQEWIEYTLLKPDGIPDSGESDLKAV